MKKIDKGKKMTVTFAEDGKDDKDIMKKIDKRK